MSFYLPSLVVGDGDCLENLVVVEGGNAAGVAMRHETSPAAAAVSHIAPFPLHTHAGHGSCSALPSHGYDGETRNRGACLIPCQLELDFAVCTCHCLLVA